jgi:hypothetical protein
MNIVRDREFIHLMKAGRPGTSLPTPMTVARDVKVSFEVCRKRIDKILKVNSTLFFCILTNLYTFVGSSWTYSHCN